MQFIRFTFLASSIVIFSTSLSVVSSYHVLLGGALANTAVSGRLVRRICCATRLLFIYQPAGLAGSAARAIDTLDCYPKLSVRPSRARAEPVVREGIFLYKRGIDPYAGGVFHHVGVVRRCPAYSDAQSPLYLQLFQWLPLEPWCAALAWTSVDMLAASAIAGISRSRGHGAWLPVALWVGTWSRSRTDLQVPLQPLHSHDVFGNINNSYRQRPSLMLHLGSM